jgi:hypothetical protein
VEHARVQDEDVPGRQLVLQAVRLNLHQSLQDMDRHQAIRRVLLERTAWIEGEQHVRNGWAMEERDLAVAVLCFVRLAAERS